MKLPEELDKRRKLTTQQKEEIYQLSSEGWGDVELGLMFNVSRSTIYFIRRQDKYADCLRQNRENGKKRPLMDKKKHAKYMAELRKRKENL
jgi:IS30 family transposase